MDIDCANNLSDSLKEEEILEAIEKQDPITHIKSMSDVLSELRRITPDFNDDISTQRLNVINGSFDEVSYAIGVEIVSFFVQLQDKEIVNGKKSKIKTPEEQISNFVKENKQYFDDLTKALIWLELPDAVDPSLPEYRRNLRVKNYMLPVDMTMIGILVTILKSIAGLGKLTIKTLLDFVEFIKGTKSITENVRELISKCSLYIPADMFCLIYCAYEHKLKANQIEFIKTSTLENILKETNDSSRVLDGCPYSKLFKKIYGDNTDCYHCDVDSKRCKFDKCSINSSLLKKGRNFGIVPTISGEGKPSEEVYEIRQIEHYVKLEDEVHAVFHEQKDE